jgi:hypothetical protein
MTFKPSPKQALFLWKLITSNQGQAEGVMSSKTRPELKPTEREELVRNELLHVEEKGRAKYLRPTDKAWAWAANASDVTLLKSRSSVGAEALEALLHRLLPFLSENGMPLADLFATRAVESGLSMQQVKKRAHGAQHVENGEALSQRIEAACLALSGGARKARVRLTALRRALSGVDRAALDEALLSMQDGGQIVLYRDDNSAGLTQDDHEAALHVGGAPRHIVYLEA